MAYFNRSGEASDEAGRWAHFSHLPALHLVPGIAFQPITTDSVMTNFVTFEPNAVADMHHHSEQQIAIVISGELTFTVGRETRVTHAGDCVVIPPHVPHGGHAGPEGCTAIDVFTPPRAGIVDAVSFVRVYDRSLASSTVPHRCDSSRRLQPRLVPLPRS